MVRQQEHRFLLDTPRADSIPSCRYETMKEGASMKIVVLLSQKGGTGKSTIATHLAVCAARDGKAVALFDIDPQASAAKWSDRRTVEGPPVVRAGAAQLPNLVQQARKQGAEVILIDTAGHADASSLHALQLADLVLIPCRPSAADLDAIEETITLAQRAKQGKAAVVINAAPIRGHLTEDARTAISERITVAPVTLGQRSAYANAWIDGRSVEEYEPKGKAADEIRALYKWIMTT
jgi:chromosome partitioning protein